MDKFIRDMVKQRRIDANLSQEQLAERANVSEKTISRIENGKGNSTLLPYIFKALNISFTEIEPDVILSEHRSIKNPNVKNGVDLAHLLIHCEHLDYYPDTACSLDDREEWIIEEFMKKIEAIMDVLGDVEFENRLTLINILDAEIQSLSMSGFYIYGSCNDTLVNPFKYTELVFAKI